MKPIIQRINDNIYCLKQLEEELILKGNEKSSVILKYPTVYIHNWEDGEKYEAYVGESNDIIQRTKEHYLLKKDPNAWQSKLDENNAELYIVGYEKFHKSLTLDIENRMIQYLSAADSISEIHNKRPNPQNLYYMSNELDAIFSNVWSELRKLNKKLFPSESEIKASAIYKASPLHKLTPEQNCAREQILSIIHKALNNNETGQLIFVEGRAGTGKTVLNSSTFYEFVSRNNEQNKALKTVILVNHDEQVIVYNSIIEKLGLKKDGFVFADKPTKLINRCKGQMFDVIFIDEGHLLLTQALQAYQGKNHLEDLLKMAKVVVVMFDERQIMKRTQIWENNQIQKLKEEAIKNKNYILLNKQLRMAANDEVVDWIDSLLDDGVIKDIPKSDYDLKIYDDPNKLFNDIKIKSQSEETKLSRVVASYDWDYNEKPKKDGSFWEVEIGDFHKPWNRELFRTLSRAEKLKNSDLSWAEQSHTIDEIGSIFTIQGFDLNYAGVIIGPSVKFIDGKIVYDSKLSFNKKAIENRKCADNKMHNYSDTLLRNELGVLLTRGVNGLYIYACDKNLRTELLKRQNKNI